MPPGQRQPKAFSASVVAGLSSFNIMWHYAQVAERNPRVTHIMSAPLALRARCGYFGHGERLAAGVRLLVRCGAQLARSLCCEHRARSSASAEWPPSLAAQAPASAFSKHQGQPHSRSRSFVTALNGFMPARLRLAARGRSRRLLASSPLASFRYPPRCGVVMQTRRFPPARCTRASQADACGLFAARTRRTRPASPNELRKPGGLPW